MKIFFDVGAGTGTTFDWFLCKTQEYDGALVYAIEPSIRQVPALMERAEALGTRFHIVVCPFAISRAEDTEVFYYKAEDQLGDGLTERWLTNVPQKFQLRVATKKLSTFILDQSLPEDEVTVKLDCEGAEYDIMKDLLSNSHALARVKRLLVEYHDEQSNANLIVELETRLKTAGLTVEPWRY